MPILYTETNQLRKDTKEALQSWGVKKVIIAGGTGVVSSGVELELASMGIEIQRLSGQDRYTTALEVAKYFEPRVGYTNISVATGLNYPDALTGAVLAAKYNAPLVLVNKDKVLNSVAEYFNSQNIENAFIFGGYGVVSGTVIRTDN